MPRTIAIVQARTGSTRLPAKVMATLAGRPVLTLVVQRLQRAHELDGVMVATTTGAGDDAVVRLCAGLGVPVYRGSEDDVLERYIGAAREQQAEDIVRITADCPLVDANLVDSVVRLHREEGADYTSNCLPPTFPDGLDVEVVRRQALERAHLEATRATDREHVTAFIQRRQDIFRHAVLRADVDRSALRLTLDEPEDLELLNRLYALADDPFVSWVDAVALLDRHPELVSLNVRHDRDAAYRAAVAREEKEAGRDHAAG